MSQNGRKYFSVFIIIIFHFALPTADNLSDWILINRLVVNQHFSWAKLSSIPIVIATFFHFLAWIFEENRNQVIEYLC